MRMIRNILFVALLAILVSPTLVYSGERYVDGKHYYLPDQGFVPDEGTAIKIAEAVWISLYGREQIEGERPFQAELQGDVWHVIGSLPEGMLGGTAEAEIQKADGKILRVSHGE